MSLLCGYSEIAVNSLGSCHAGTRLPPWGRCAVVGWSLWGRLVVAVHREVAG